MTEFLYLHFSFGLIHPFYTEQLHTDSAPATLQPMHDSGPVFPLSAQKESPQPLCCHCHSLLCLPAQGCIPQYQHGASAHAALAGQPWQGRKQSGAGANAQSILAATSSLPTTHLLCADFQLHLASPSCGSPPCPQSSSFLAPGLGSSG